ncbi:MAG TPA: YjfB family protein [Metalysinibacillus jejuensis]|uniref:YjfB family protein n=1 Tax=Metalysinibacillus jejuensis TaxID=914327 RepID=A0A921T4X2_9BACL|nr:YjfB family protein [Metalysinibacillus jejuensis]HJH10952.1 YjfB family protein [Metalysinibacillus jejuensis]
MDIAALAMNMSQAKLMQDVSLAVTKQAMEMQEQQTTQLVEMLDAPHPTAGQNFDISI